MIKREELMNQQSCINRAHSDEMVFVLLARDAAAPFAIHAWIEGRILLGLNKRDDEQIKEALECVKIMERKAHCSGCGWRGPRCKDVSRP